MGRREKAKGGDGYFHRKTRKDGGKDIEYGNWLTKYYITVTDEEGEKKRVALYANHATDDHHLAMTRHLEWLKQYQSGSIADPHRAAMARQLANKKM